MKVTSTQLQAKLMRDYYNGFSKYERSRREVADGGVGGVKARKTAWVTAFTPVELLEALDIAYFYPESYAAVIAASSKEQEMLTESEKQALCRDCCSYACCIEGSLLLRDAPRGMPPDPDLLIATNNQCNTLVGWWNLLAKRYDVPLVVLDYPGEHGEDAASFEYVREQHGCLISLLEEMSGNTLDMGRLSKLLDQSADSVSAWSEVCGMPALHCVSPTKLFDGISFLITSRCKPETAQLYGLLAAELANEVPADEHQTALFWIGYPLWYHQRRYLAELTEGKRICGMNYTTWWNLDYSGKDPMERLYNAYNFTFLNLTHETKTQRLSDLIKNSGAQGAITLRNKSCKCDFVSARSIGLPQAELEIDMIDRNFLDIDRAKRQIELLLESL